jgi:hypothetical protein
MWNTARWSLQEVCVFRVDESDHRREVLAVDIALGSVTASADWNYLYTALGHLSDECTIRKLEMLAIPSSIRMTRARSLMLLVGTGWEAMRIETDDQCLSFTASVSDEEKMLICQWRTDIWIDRWYSGSFAIHLIWFRSENSDITESAMMVQTVRSEVTFLCWIARPYGVGERCSCRSEPEFGSDWLSSNVSELLKALLWVATGFHVIVGIGEEEGGCWQAHGLRWSERSRQPLTSWVSEYFALTVVFDRKGGVISNRSFAYEISLSVAHQ